MLLLWMALGCSDPAATVEAPPKPVARADVVSARAKGQPGAYVFEVNVNSNDLGCEQYANWWEVVTLDGKLLFRRVLRHSHPDEQPFKRSGGPVPVRQDEEVVVRAHMHPSGYTGAALKGSVKKGFRPVADLPADFAAKLERAEPQPKGCLY